MDIDAEYFEDTHSYFVRNAYTTSFNGNKPVTMNLTATNLPIDTISMTKLKEGNEHYFGRIESLFFSAGVAYSGLYVSRPGITHAGNYETQLHLTSLFSGFECNSIYNDFLASPNYLGIQGGTVILQSTIQRMAYYGKL